MLFEVLGLTYHIPITIEWPTYRVLLRTPWYSSRDATQGRVCGFDLCRFSLELGAHSSGHHRDRSAVAVERRIDDELVIVDDRLDARMG